MSTIYKHEMKLLWKTFWIWTLAVGGMCFVCILLFNSMKGEMEGMADSFSQMGAFADAFANDQDFALYFFMKMRRDLKNRKEEK